MPLPQLAGLDGQARVPERVPRGAVDPAGRALQLTGALRHHRAPRVLRGEVLQGQVG